MQSRYRAASLAVSLLVSLAAGASSDAAEPWPPLGLPEIACRGTEHCGRFVEDNPGWPCHMPTLFLTAKNPDVAWHTAQQHIDWASNPLHSYVADGTGALTVVAHPGRWQEELLASLKGLTGMEVCHGGDFSRGAGGRWDRVLRARLRKGLTPLWGFASDDTHSSRRSDRSWLAARLGQLKEHDLKAALRTGSFYVSTGPVITDVQVSGPTVSIKLGQPADVRWLKCGQYGTATRHGIAPARVVSPRRGVDRCLKLDKAVRQSSYTLNAADGTTDPEKAMFIRCIVSTAGRAAMTQPFLVRSARELANPYAARGKWYKGMTHNHTDALEGDTGRIAQYHADYAKKGHACAFETGYDYWLVPLQIFPPDRTPVIDRVEPMRVAAGQGRRAEVHGRAFRAGAKLFVNGEEIPGAKRLSPDRFQFALPGDLKVGSHTVTVRNADGLQASRQNALIVVESLAAASGWTHYAPHNSKLGSRHTYALAADGSGGVWVATNYGLNRYADGRWKLYRRKGNGLIANTIYDLAVDADGSAWFTCFRGMGRIGPEGKLTQWRALDEKLPSKQVNQILRVGGATYVSTHNRSGLFVFRDGAWRAVKLKTGSSRPPKVHGMAADEKGRIWMGSNAGLLRWDPAKGDAGWKLHTTKNSALPDNYVYRVAFDARGALWAATATRSDGPAGGLARWDGSKWAAWSPANSPLPERRVWSVFPDREGNVWAGTSRGAACLTAGGEWRVFTTLNSGLADNMVTDICQDARGDMWFATANGVCRLDARARDRLLGGKPAAPSGGP